MDPRRDQLRTRALDDLRQHGVVMDGHFDFGNGYHGPLYLNPHALFRVPSTIWRVAQDLLDLLPATLIEATDVVAGPATGGALLAHTMAGLLEGRRPLTREPYCFAPFQHDPSGQPALSPFYAKTLAGRRVLLVDDVRNTGQTFRRCADLVTAAGGTVVGSAVIVDRCEAVTTLDVPNIALVEYPAPANHAADRCPLCASGTPVTAF